VWLGNPAPQELHEILKDFGLSDRLATACSSWNGKERALRRLLMQRSVHVSDVAERLARLPSPVVSILQAKLEVAKATEAQALLTHALSALEAEPLISGADLIAIGIHQGRRIAQLLGQVRRLQLDGLIDSKEAALAYVRTMNG